MRSDRGRLDSGKDSYPGEETPSEIVDLWLGVASELGVERREDDPRGLEARVYPVGVEQAS